MTKLVSIITILFTAFLAFGAGVSDEALFNQIINSQKDKYNLGHNQPQNQDRNLIELNQQNQNNRNGQGQTIPANIYQMPMQKNDLIRTTLQTVPKEYKNYGHDMFTNSDATDSIPSSGQFIADQNVNIPDDYLLGAGDTVKIQFWGRTASTEELILDRSGEIYSETLGRINLGGQSYAQARNIVSKMTAGMEGVSASLVINNTKTVKILVSGSVNKPGYYILNVFGNVTQAIVSAGGVKDFADIRKVALIRNGKTIDSIDYYDMVNNGAYRPKIQKLMPNDVIFIPRTSKRVLVEGAVKNEAYYDIKNEKNINEVIKLAGGLASGALSNNIVVTRVNKANMKYTVKSLDISKGKDAGFKVEDGDRNYYAK